ncbi:MAG: cation:dicarboxylase symporter family transporter, partial [Gammaproteobacteria bacterium]|nr:cation:dicarboxylase symporter family transporter [Gammaproteobacteria bacterium]
IMAFLLSFGLPASAVYFSRREIFSLQVILVSYTGILLPILLLATAFALCNFDTILTFTGWPTPSFETMVLVMLSVSFLTCSNLGSSMLLAAGRAKPVAMINVAKVFSAVIFSYVALVHFSVGVRALIVGFVLPFDRILDMARTVVNITGDATVSVLVAKSEGELDETEFRDTSGDF